MSSLPNFPKHWKVTYELPSRKILKLGLTPRNFRRPHFYALCYTKEDAIELGKRWGDVVVVRELTIDEDADLHWDLNHRLYLKLWLPSIPTQEILNAIHLELWTKKDDTLILGYNYTEVDDGETTSLGNS